MSSYAVWAVSRSFSMFLLFRIIGGICKGNVSLCTAIVADMPCPKVRNRGMVGTSLYLSWFIHIFYQDTVTPTFTFYGYENNTADDLAHALCCYRLLWPGNDWYRLLLGLHRGASDGGLLCRQLQKHRECILWNSSSARLGLQCCWFALYLVHAARDSLKRRPGQLWGHTHCQMMN